MPKKNDFKLDVVSVRLVKDAPIYSEHTFNNPADIAAVMGDCMCQFDREVVCVVNLRSDLKPINVHFASVGSLNEAMAHPRELFKSSILSNAAKAVVHEFGQAVLEDINPRDSWRASKAFRQHIATVLAERALTESIRLAGGVIDE